MLAWDPAARPSRREVEREATRLAAQRPGVNVNLLASTGQMDAPSGNAVLNAIPVTVEIADELTR